MKVFGKNYQKCICMNCGHEWWDDIETLNGRCPDCNEPEAGFLSQVKKDKNLYLELVKKQIRKQ